MLEGLLLALRRQAVPIEVFPQVLTDLLVLVAGGLDLDLGDGRRVRNRIGDRRRLGGFRGRVVRPAPCKEGGGKKVSCDQGLDGGSVFGLPRGTGVSE